MPRRRTHLVIGAGTGLALGALRSEDLPPDAAFVLVLSSCLGGYVMANTPDEMEPADSPWHRGVFHSVAAAAVVGTVLRSLATSASPFMREEAQRIRLKRLQLAESDPQRFWLWCSEMLMYTAEGLLLGSAAGYLSHITADATTPHGIPLIG